LISEGTPINTSLLLSHGNGACDHLAEPKMRKVLLEIL
jgi:hypothetical protein